MVTKTYCKANSLDRAVQKARANKEWMLVALNERSEFSKTVSVA